MCPGTQREWSSFEIQVYDAVIDLDAIGSRRLLWSHVARRSREDQQNCQGHLLAAASTRKDTSRRLARTTRLLPCTSWRVGRCAPRQGQSPQWAAAKTCMMSGDAPPPSRLSVVVLSSTCIKLRWPRSPGGVQCRPSNFLRVRDGSFYTLE